jgi:ABC-type transporter MlaC component
MWFRLSVAVLSGIGASMPTSSTPSSPIAFVREHQLHVEHLLRQPPTASRSALIDQSLKTFFDYDEIVRRAFGAPGPFVTPSAENLWSGFSDAQRGELRGLIGSLLRKTYQRRLEDALDYAVTYRGARNVGGDTLVTTVCSSFVRTHEPGVHVDYLVEQGLGGPKVVDILADGASLTGNYYIQFRRELHAAGEGYESLVRKLTHKIAERD